MSQINLNSISGITSITTPAGVDNQLTFYTNDTTERFKIDSVGNLHSNGKLTINPDDGTTTWKRENKNMHQIRDDVYIEGTVNVGDKAGFDATSLGITTFTWVSAATSYYSLTTNVAHAIPQGTNVLIKDSVSGFQEAYNTTSGAGTTITVERAVDPSSELSVANTTVVVYTPADPRGCLNVAKDYAKVRENGFNPILRGFVGSSTTHPVGINTEVFKIEIKRDGTVKDGVATLLHSTREMGSKQRLALTIDDGDSYPDGKNLVLTQTGVKITANDSAFSDANALLEVDGNVAIDDNLDVGSNIKIGNAGVITATSYNGSGASLTNLNASNISSGTVPSARLGYGTASSSTFLAGDSTFKTVTGTTINNNANYRLISGDANANELNAEPGLTYNGQAFQVNSVTSENNAFRIYNTTDNSVSYQINGEGNSFIGHTYPRSDANIDLGFHTGYRWRDVVLSGGIRFGSSSADDYLDDYEEGTYTPTINVGTFTTFLTHRYIKIGRLVHLHGGLIFHNNSSGTRVEISNIPFAQQTGQQFVGNVWLRRTSTGERNWNMVLGEAGTNVMGIFRDSNGNDMGGHLSYSDFQHSSTYFNYSITYISAT